MEYFRRRGTAAAWSCPHPPCRGDLWPPLPQTGAGHQLRGVQRDPVTVGANVLLHQADIAAVGVGLELGGLKILSVVPVIHGIGVDGTQIPGGNGGDDGGIQPAGEKRPQRNIRHQLPPDGILHQKAGLLAGLLKAVGAGRIPEGPVAADMQPRFVKIAAGTGSSS